MDKESKLQYQKDVEKYLEEKKVYDVFEELMKNLIIEQPEEPLDYLIKKLSETDQKRIFIVGPPGSKIRELSLELSNYLNYTCISVGDLLKKEISKKSDIGQQIENYVKQYQYVKDEIVIDIVMKKIDEVSQFEDSEKKNFVLEGFPKTRVQGLALQRKGIIPSSFIIYNLDEEDQQQKCLAKVQNSEEEGYYTHIQGDMQDKYAQNHSLEYKLNLEQVKEIYGRNFFQVDAYSKQEPLEDIAKLVVFKVDSKAPKRSARIIVMGPPGSGRSTISRKLASKYGLVYVSTKEIINNQIKKNTELGQIALQQQQKCELINDEIINGLVNERIRQVDCHIQGYILDGFPKNLVQLLNLEDMKISPSLIVILEVSDEVVSQRLQARKIDPYTGIEYDRLNPTNDPNVQKRLQGRPGEAQELIAKRNRRWKELLKSVETTFQQQSHLLLKLSGEQDPQNIVEQVSIHMEKAI